MKVANAPLSYGAFELTVGIYPNVPGPDELLAAIAAAGYEGTELGPPGYLGDGDELRARLDETRPRADRRLVPDPLLAARAPRRRPRRAAAHARPVRGRGRVDGAAGVRRRRLARAARESGRGKDEPSLRLDDAGWTRFADGLARAESLARARGFAPVFHAHTSTYVEAPAEIDRLLELSSIDLLVDTGHLLVGGSDPIQALRDWGPRVGYVHLKDARLDVVREVVAEGVGGVEAWRRGVFCELGTGDVDLDGVPRGAARDRLRRLAVRRAGPHPARRRAAVGGGRGAGQEPRVAAAAAGSELVERRHRLGAGELAGHDRARDRAEPHALDQAEPAHERVAERGPERVAGAEAVHDLDRRHRHVGDGAVGLEDRRAARRHASAPADERHGRPPPRPRPRCRRPGRRATPPAQQARGTPPGTPKRRAPVAVEDRRPAVGPHRGERRPGARLLREPVPLAYSSGAAATSSASKSAGESCQSGTVGRR